MGLLQGLPLQFKVKLQGWPLQLGKIVNYGASVFKKMIQSKLMDGIVTGIVSAIQMNVAKIAFASGFK